MNGIITNIQRFSVHDGPGIRTTVFMKGCNLRCIWCHNPETYSSKIEVEYFENRCTGCMHCVDACSHGALSFENGKVIRDRSKCVSCLECEDKCLSGATSVCGKTYTPQELCDILLKDIKYYQKSGGGVTFSGGEPLLQSEFVFECVDILKAHAVHCAVETASNVNREVFQKAIEKFDYFMCDIKAMDTELHKKLTGVPNGRILSNLELLASSSKPTLIRVPVAMTLNGTEENILATAQFMKKCGFDSIELLKLHRLSDHKYKALDLEETHPDIPDTTDSDIEHFYSLIENIIQKEIKR